MPPLEVGPQVNKFDDHQISVAGEGGRSPGLISRRGGTYHVTYPIMHVMLLTYPL